MTLNDCYKILGLEENPSISMEEIKKAFKKKAFEKHPDINKEKGAEEEFKLLNEAFRLIKKEKEKKVSIFYNTPFKDIFNGFHQPKKPIKGEVILVKLYIPLRKTVKKYITSVILNMYAVCDKCFNGKTNDQKICTNCLGMGKVKKRRTLKVEVPAGVKDGEELFLFNEGNCGYNGGLQGDIVFKIVVKKDPLFKRKDNNVFTEIKIGLLDAIFGKNVVVETLWDKNSEIKILPGTQCGTVYCGKGLGFPDVMKGTGNMYITVSVDIPNGSEFNEKQKQCLKKMKELNNEY